MKQLLTFLLMIFCQHCLAQFPDYYVYLVTGPATLTRNGSKPIKIIQKQLVYKSDIITLNKGSELTLVDLNSSFLEIRTAGTFTAGDAAKKGEVKKNDGLTAKYLKLLYHELLDPKQDFESFKKQNVAAVWGGVSRGDNCKNMLYPVGGLKTSALSITFRWHKTSSSGGYNFRILDIAGKQLFKQDVTDTVFVLSLKDAHIEKPGLYMWHVAGNISTGCEEEIPLRFELLTKEMELKSKDELLSHIFDRTVVGQLERINTLEKNGFVEQAIYKYKEMLSADPTNKALRKSYTLFLLKFGNVKEAAAEWKKLKI